MALISMLLNQIEQILPIQRRGAVSFSRHTKLYLSRIICPHSRIYPHSRGNAGLHGTRLPSALTASPLTASPLTASLLTASLFTASLLLAGGCEDSAHNRNSDARRSDSSSLSDRDGVEEGGPTDSGPKDSGPDTRIFADGHPDEAPAVPVGTVPFPEIPAWRPSQPPGLVASSLPVASCTGVVETRAVLCVDDSAAVEGQDGTASHPYRQVSQAVAAAKAGDLIQVAAGSYTENIQIDDRSLVLEGGFSPTFAERVPASYISTLQGAGEGAVVSTSGGRIELSGFRITGGTGSGLFAGSFMGGGVFVNEGTAVIEHNVIEENDLTVHSNMATATIGGAIYAVRSDTSIRRNVIRANRAGRGAVATTEGKVRVEENAVLDNVAIADHGGGLYITGADITVTGNLVARNRVVPKNGSGGWGAGILVYNEGGNTPRTHGILSRNVVTANHAPQGGSGTFIDDGADMTLQNELIYGNTCPETGAAGLYVDGLNTSVKSSVQLINCTIAAHPCGATAGTAIFVEQSHVTMRNSIIWDDGEQPIFVDDRSSFAATHSISPLGEGTLQVDPAFAASSLDFHLKSKTGRFDPMANDRRGGWVKDDVQSPAIDAADPADAIGDEPAPNGGRRNLGAYGGTNEASLASTQ